jgi:hypothetical protein
VDEPSEGGSELCVSGALDNRLEVHRRLCESGSAGDLV